MTAVSSGADGISISVNYMIMIHKLFVERLQSYLIHRCCCDDPTSSSRWTTTNHHSDAENQKVMDDDFDESNNNQYFSLQIVHTPIVTGASQARHGYKVLYITTTTSAGWAFRQYLYDLSPMIRQNISWIYHIQHQSTITASTHDTNDTSERIGTRIWPTLFSSEFPSSSPPISGSDRQSSPINMNDLANVLLRVDCYPQNQDFLPKLLEGVCQQLQHLCGTAVEHCHQKNTSATQQNDRSTGNDCPSNNNNNNEGDDYRYCNCDPFDGPIPMTMSKSKCTHRLSIVVIRNMETTSSSDGETIRVYWGIECRHGNRNQNNRLMMDLPLNHDAAAEILVIPGIDHHHHDLQREEKKAMTAIRRKQRQSFSQLAVTPKDGSHDSTSIVPLSRAYYKLHEIWYTYLVSAQENRTLFQQLNNSNVAISAIDLGAAPGGWTQVLLNHVNVSYVLAIDRAELAHRDRFLLPCSNNDDIHRTVEQQIFHVQTTMEKLNLQLFYENYERKQCLDYDHAGTIHQTTYDSTTNNTTVLLPPKLFSYLVCDASVQWNLLLPMILQQLQQPINMDVIQWTIPSVLIVTLKLPFKRIHSIRRHVLEIRKQVPLFLQTLSMIMYGKIKSTTIVSRYRIVHCMANSESERTLLAFFESL